MIDLGGDDCPDFTAKAFGLNEKGQITGEFRCPDGTVRAFYWLPAPDPDYGPTILVEQLVAFGPVHSTGKDISNPGAIAGWVGIESDASPSSSDAVVFHLFDDPISTNVIPDNVGTSVYMAEAVNNLPVTPEPDYQVVGQMWLNSLGEDRGFFWEFGSGTVIELMSAVQLPQPRHTNAFDLSTPAPSDTPVIGGREFDCVFLCNVCGVIGDASAWDDRILFPSPKALRQPPTFVAPGGTDEMRGTANGINDPPYENLVGSGRDDIPMSAACLDRALFWESSQDLAPSNLGSLVPPTLPGQPPDETIANAISTASDRAVAGQNTDELTAVRWQLVDPGSPDDPASWCFDDLNDLVSPNCNWDLIDATDVERVTFDACVDDWIVGWGLHGTELRAFLLVPVNFECLGDTDCDAFVGAIDLSNVIQAWGPCPIGELCGEDTNGDCVVNTQDLSNVIQTWGPCPSGGQESSFAPPEVVAIAELFATHPTPQMAAVCCELLEQLP